VDRWARPDGRESRQVSVSAASRRMSASAHATRESADAKTPTAATDPSSESRAVSALETSGDESTRKAIKTKEDTDGNGVFVKRVRQVLTRR
jgi:hypothetical protein